MRVRVRLFAVQRELAGTREVALELADGATIEGAWEALAARFPLLRPGRAAVRFARNGVYADPADQLSDGDELACIPPVSGGAGGSTNDSVPDPAPDSASDAAEDPRIRIVELRPTPFGAAILGELADRLVTPGDGGVVGFLGRTRITPGTPAPGQEAEAARHSGRSVDGLAYEAHESMARAILADIADEVERRFEVRRLAIVHRTGEVPLGDVSVAVVAVAPHRDAAFRAARYAIDETKARAPIWKAERYADGHVWVGAPARTAAADPEA